MRKTFFFGLFVFTAFQSKASEFAQINNLKVFAEKLRTDKKIPAISLGIIQNGKILMAEGLGLRDREKQLPANAETLFGIGSNSKAFTAVLAAQQVDQKLLTLDGALKQFFPELQLSDPIAESSVSMRDLLSHQSGQARHDLMWLGATATRQELLARLPHLETNLKFREKHQYSNLMYMLAGAISEKLGSKNWDTLLKEKLFNPLQMNRSNSSAKNFETLENIALPYTENSSGQIVRRGIRVLDNMGPCGSINSNINDMLKWVEFLISQKTPDQKSLLSSEMFEELYKPLVAVESTYNKFPEFTPQQYAMGFRIHKYRGTSVVRHGGSIGGFVSSVVLLPDLKTGIVVLQNVDHFDAHHYIALRAMDLLLGLPPIDWISRVEALPLHLQLKEDSDILENIKLEDPMQIIEDPQSENLVGEFTNAGYGKIKIFEKEKRLHMQFNDWTSTLTLNKFPIYKSSGNYNGDVEFELVNGKVKNLRVNFETAVNAIRFEK